MKLGIFTDSHYSSQDLTCKRRYNNKSLNKIKEAYSFFEQENCELIICLGDLIDRENCHQTEIDNLKEIANVINNSSVKTICLMGNHDAFAFTKDEFYGILNGSKPTNISIEDKSLLFLDTCYFKNGKHYAPGDSDWTDTFYPDTNKLEQTLLNCNKDAYVFSHHNLDTNIRNDHRVYNASEINTILHQSKKVRAVYQGHYHKGKKSILNDIIYITLPAMCENEKAYFILYL